MKQEYPQFSEPWSSDTVEQRHKRYHKYIKAYHSAQRRSEHFGQGSSRERGICHREAGRQTCAVPGRSIHDNLHLMRYITNRIMKEPRMGVTLMYMVQSKAFNRVDHCYLEAFHQVTVWIAAL